MKRTHLDLFSGIGGFSLAAESVGFTTVGFSEIDPYATKLLKQHWPDVPNHGDIRITDFNGCRPELITGGDPCPCHSRARSNGASKHPDLSGYFLALVARLRPRWVVRENVPAPTVAHFAAALEAIGYGTVVVRTNAGSFTAQTRQRDFIVGSDSVPGTHLKRTLLSAICDDGAGAYETRLGTRPVAPALTTHRTRYDSRDCYIYEPGTLRILESEEREALAGFPRGWTDGFSPATRARMLGNSLVPQVAAEIIKAMIESEWTR